MRVLLLFVGTIFLTTDSIPFSGLGDEFIGGNLVQRFHPWVKPA